MTAGRTPPVGAHFGEEREELARGFGGRLRLGTVPHRMLNGDVGRVQGPVSGEGVAVQENGLFSAGGGAFVLTEVRAGEALHAREFTWCVEVQPGGVGVGGALGVEGVGADDRFVGGGMRSPAPAPPARLPCACDWKAKRPLGAAW